MVSANTLILVALAVGASQALVPVNIYSMGHCPCSAQFAVNFNRTIWSDPELRAAITLKEPFEAYIHLDNTIHCFHGEAECRFQKWLLCAQKQDFAAAFAYQICADGLCTWNASSKFPNCETQKQNPDNRTLGEACAATHGIDYSAMSQCATSDAGDQLLRDDVRHYNASFGFQGAPVVEVNGKVLTHFFQCVIPIEQVLAAICESIPGTKPTACTTY
eukprot:TRINITY_DN6001_c0_g1_i1.p1 TRINITY_DN6001_c0_g1~~TRINITY_DN6001_c0_g1_i1.p1  ORF type:complete len:218 (+),score=34.46 TRINITY_DN6001_c0_g1_i1:157-810(+)